MVTPTKATKSAPAKRAVKAAPPAKAAAKAPAKKAAKAAPGPEVAPGWYKDPADPTTKRYWDGEGWLGAPLPAHIVSDGAPPAEETTAEEQPADGPVAITWRNRVMPVQRPDAGMVGVWALTAREMTPARVSSMSTQEAADAAGRAIRISTSVLEDLADKSWILDLLLDKKTTIEQVAEILTLTNDAYQKLAQEQGNREERRAAPKARLR